MPIIFKIGKRDIAVHIILQALLCSLIPSMGQSATFLQVLLKDSRQVIWEKPIASGDQFCLVHRNSIYGSLVWESFVVDTEGAIWLKRIKTGSPAVLEYYGLEDSSADWIKLSRKIGRIPLLITPLGEVRLVWGKEKVALSSSLPEGTSIEIRTHKQP